MAFPIAYSSRRRTDVTPTPPAGWRLRGAEFAAALAMNLGTIPTSEPPAPHRTDRGVLMAADPSAAAVLTARTGVVAVRPSITSWR